MVKKYAKQLLIPGLEESLENMKTEIAEEFGVPFNTAEKQQKEHKQNKKRS